MLSGLYSFWMISTRRQSRVVRSAAPKAAVQILRRPLDFDFDIAHAAQAVGDGWFFYDAHGRIADDAHISFQQIHIFLDEGCQVRGGDFFFTLDQEFQD